VTESDTLSSTSPKNSTDDQDPQTKKSFHDNGKAVVPYRKKSRGKKKGSQRGTPLSVGTDEPQLSPPALLGEGGPPAGGGEGEITARNGTQPKRKKKPSSSSTSHRTLKEPKSPPQKASSTAGEGSVGSPSPSLSPSSSSLSPKTQAAELREKTSTFWSNLRLSL
jgi:hypothetical protein